MKCPSCKTTELIKTERQGFILDHCPECKGIWFERIELDRILLKLNEIDLATPEKESVYAEKENGKEEHPDKDVHHPKKEGAILDSMHKSKDLHTHYSNQGVKHHWMHRLFN